LIRDPLEHLARLQGESSEILGRSRAGTSAASTAHGTDETGAVTVTLDGDGRVVGVRLESDSKARLGPDGVGAAVRDAARAAALSRFTNWGEAYGGADTEPAGPEANSAAEVAVELERLIVHRRRTSEDISVALRELLSMAEAIDRGIDDVSARLQSATVAEHTGHNQDRQVTVTITGGGDVVDVRYDQRWLREAHEFNIGRQTVAAFRAAYELAAQHGVHRLIAESPLGEVQQTVQDPARLARLLRLS
jgi:DNA-binding protein YbaB